MSKEVLTFGNARIGFRNFEGREGPYNNEGDRSFAIFLSHEEAEELSRAGWNVKFPKDQDENDEDDRREPFISVAISVDKNKFPASIYVIAKTQGDNNTYKSTLLKPEEVGMLDWAEIDIAKLVIRPYNWTVNKKSGIKAYLKSAYITLSTDEFADEYGI